MTAKDETKVDLTEIIPEEGVLEIGGVKVRVKRLKTREFFSLLRVITSGLGPAIQNFKLSSSMSQEDMAAQVIAMATWAIPNALDEFSFFLRDVVEPVGTVEAGVLQKALDNPEIEETMEIIVMIVQQEAGDFRSLVGKAQTVFSKLPSMIQQTGK